MTIIMVKTDKKLPVSMKTNIRSLILCAVLLLAIASCQRGTLLHQFQPISSTGWERTDTFHFSLPQVEQEGLYQVSVGLRYEPTFRYQDLWLVADITTTMLPTDSAARSSVPVLHASRTIADTLCLPLLASRAKSSSGVTLLQTEAPLCTLRIEPNQSVSLRLRHIMQREQLQGIRDVGLHVTRCP